MFALALDPPLPAESESESALAAGLQRHFGLDRFRPGQAEVIQAVLAGRNCVVVMPTGAGKSLCYQLPAVLLDGVALVVSPLIALMQDQVDQLAAKGIAATFINSSLSEAERRSRLSQLRARAFKLVYVAPERFRSDAFMAALSEVPVSLYAIDEAHCISQWGHDFRPDYALLGQVRKRLRPPRTVALTATATPEVRDDLARVLLLKDPLVFVAGFDRPNLFLEVARVGGDADKLNACRQLVAEGGSGLVYCSTRRQAEGLYSSLKRGGAKTVLYHAGMGDEERREAQEHFMAPGDVVAVATNAFGMGIDKPDIRFVAHAGIPRAVEAYYQEIGRAGRDGKPAKAVLLFNHADVFTQERLIAANHPTEALFADLWKALLGGRGDGDERSIAKLASQLGSSPFEVSAALRVLEREGVLARSSRGAGRYHITVAPGARSHHPRSAPARALLATLCSSGSEGSVVSSELSHLAFKTGLDEETTRHGLGLLERAGAIQVVRPFAGRRLTPLRPEPWAKLGIDLSRLRREEQNQLSLLKRMTAYAYGTGCRRAYVLRYFGEQVVFGSSCGACDGCVGPRLRLGAGSPERRGEVPSRARPEAFSFLAAEELKRWRRELAKDLSVPAFIIMNDATLYALATSLPTNRQDFLRVKGTGAARWERFGPRVVEICRVARAASGGSVLATGAPGRRARPRV